MCKSNDLEFFCKFADGFDAERAAGTENIFHKGLLLLGCLGTGKIDPESNGICLICFVALNLDAADSGAGLFGELVDAC